MLRIKNGKQQICPTGFIKSRSEIFIW